MIRKTLILCAGLAWGFLGFCPDGQAAISDAEFNRSLRQIPRDARNDPRETLQGYRQFLEKTEDLTRAQRLRLDKEIASRQLRVEGDVQAFLDAMKAVLEPRDGEAPEAALTVKLTVAMLGELMKFDLPAALNFVAKHSVRFDDAQRVELAQARVQAAIFSGDWQEFSGALEAFEQTGDPVKRLPHYLAIANALKRENHAAAEELLRRALLLKEYNEAHQHQLLTGLRRLYPVRAFQYNRPFYTPGSYEKYKELALEDLAVVERGLANGTLSWSFGLALHTYRAIAQAAVDFGDYAFGAEVLRKAREKYPLAFHFVPLALQMSLRSGDLEQVKAVAIPVIENPKEREDNKQFLRALLHLAEANPMEDFDGVVFGATEFAPADRLAMLQRVSETMFLAGRYDVCRRIQSEIVENMFKPSLSKRYQVEFAANAPRSADAWARSEFYDRWDRMETRFEPYGNGYDISHAVDVSRHLKEAESPEIDPAYRTGVYVLYDLDGVHVFIRCDDPQIESILLGEGSAGGLELLFRPSDEAAYHSIYFRAPPLDTEDPYEVDWASPSKNYRLTRDCFVKDAAATPEGFVAHTFIPWLSFYNNLPVDGRVWRFGMQRWGKARVTLSGNVHELSRTLQLEFDFAPQTLAAIKRRLAIKAFHRYDGIRQDAGGFIQTWNDPVLGDPEFYQACVTPLLTELDDAGKRLLETTTVDEAAEICNDYLPRWAGIKYEIAERRADWLREHLLR